jgi:hypothetical protein
MIPAFVWEYKLILRFIIRVNSHLKEALCVFGGSTIQEFTVTLLLKARSSGSNNFFIKYKILDTFPSKTPFIRDDASMIMPFKNTLNYKNII